mmetsp:Transcript_54290/g.119005  ORF Transcript_54290/g.119005 Transcript_54290/m.119005 type:complete len:135 (-) Transcript_54290:1170-1574(-)
MHDRRSTPRHGVCDVLGKAATDCAGVENGSKTSLKRTARSQVYRGPCQIAVQPAATSGTRSKKYSLQQRLTTGRKYTTTETSSDSKLDRTAHMHHAQSPLRMQQRATLTSITTTSIPRHPRATQPTEKRAFQLW